MTAAFGGGELATEWVTLLPETHTLAKKLREFKPAPIRVPVEVDTDQMERETRASGRTSGRHIDTEIKRETRGTGAGVSRNVSEGLNDGTATRAARRLGRSIREEIEGESRKISFRHVGVGLAGVGRAVAETGSGIMTIIRNVGTMATVIRYAARAARGLSLSLLAGATAARIITGAGIARLGVALGWSAKQADRLATQVARVTSALLVAAAVGKFLQFMHSASKIMGLLTIGSVALVSAGAGLVTMLMGPLQSALLLTGSALGIAAGAAAGLLGPMLAVGKIGFKGMSEGAKAIQKEWKEVDEAFYKTIGERMRPMLESWHNLSNGITDSMSQALIPSFGNLGTLMDRLAPKSKILAGTFGELGNEVTRSLLSPANSAALDKMFDASNRFFRSFLGESGISGALGGLLQFSSTAADTFSGVGGSLNDMLLKFGEWLRGITPAQMKMVFATIEQSLRNIWAIVKPVYEVFKQLGTIGANALGPAFQAIGKALGDAAPGIVNMAQIIMPALSKAIQNLAPSIPALVQAFTPMATILSVILPPLASLVTQLAPLAPIILAVTTAIKAATIAMALYNTAMLVYANATKIATALQWAWNTAFAASGIGTIIVAVAALGVALWAFFTKTETGRKLWDKIWTGIKTAVKVVWDNVLKPFFNWFATSAWPAILTAGQKAWSVIKTIFSGIGTAAQWVWNNVLKPVFGFIEGGWKVLWFAVQVGWEVGKRVFEAVGNVLQWVWNSILSPIFDQLKAVWGFLVERLQWFGSVWSTVWEGLKTAVQAVWDFLKPVRDFMGDMFKNIGDMGKAAGSAISSAWSGLTNILKEPLRAIGRFLQGLPDSVLGVEIPFVGELKGWGASLAGLATGGVIKGPGTGTSDSIVGLNQSGIPTVRVSDGEGVVPKAALATPMGKMLFGMLLGLPAFAGGGVTGEKRSDGLNPGAGWLSDYIKKTFGVGQIGGRRSEDGYGEHSSGNAMDIMVGNDTALGNQIAGFLKANKDTLGLDGMIWQQRSYGYGGSWEGKYMADRGSPTQNHMDHIHAILGKGRGANAPAVALPSGTLTDPTGRGSQQLSAGSFSSYTGGTPLGGDGSSAGYYTVDKKKVREAEDRVTDMTNQLDIKQKKLDEYLAKQAKGEKVNATTIEAARDAIDKQSRDLEQAKSDLEEAKQGKYVEGRKPGKGSKDDTGSDTQWGDVGKMIFGGFLESFGLDGSVFTNLLDTPNVKSAMAGLNFGLGLLTGGDNAEAGAPQDLGIGGSGGGSGLAGAGMDMLAGIGDQAGVNIAPHGDMALAGATPGQGNAPVFDMRGSQLGVSPAAFEDKMGEMTAANRRHPTLGPV